jgi:ABC-type transport system involved in multi-copper enzyme maturation permease subunit
MIWIAVVWVAIILFAAGDFVYVAFSITKTLASDQDMNLILTILAWVGVVIGFGWCLFSCSTIVITWKSSSRRVSAYSEKNERTKLIQV